MKAIIGNFTGQQIQQQLEMGKNPIELPFYLKEIPDNTCDATIAYTQQPRVVGDRAGKMAKIDLTFELHTLLSLNLHHFVDGYFTIEIGEFTQEPDPEVIKFTLVEDEDNPLEKA